MKINRNNVYQHLLEKQFNMIDKTVQDALLERDWWITWNITDEQRIEFEKYATPLLKKVFKYNTNKAKETYKWFIENHGLNVK